MRDRDRRLEACGVNDIAAPHNGLCSVLGAEAATDKTQVQEMVLEVSLATETETRQYKTEPGKLCCARRCTPKFNGGDARNVVKCQSTDILDRKIRFLIWYHKIEGLWASPLGQVVIKIATAFTSEA